MRLTDEENCAASCLWGRAGKAAATAIKIVRSSKRRSEKGRIAPRSRRLLPHDEPYGCRGQKVSAQAVISSDESIKLIRERETHFLRPLASLRPGRLRSPRGPPEKSKSGLKRAGIGRGVDGAGSAWRKIPMPLPGRRNSYFQITKATNQPAARQMEPETRGETVIESNALIYSPKEVWASIAR
jgi:hypothetical protein